MPESTLRWSGASPSGKAASLMRQVEAVNREVPVIVG